MTYTIFDNLGNKHLKEFASDAAALDYMRSHYIDYIYSILSSDSILLCRPSGHILAFISTSDGSQVVKSMSDWGC